VNQEDSIALTEHFFRKEYGTMVSVITKYLGMGNVETAENIVQETLLKQDRNQWNKSLINQGIHYLDLGMEQNQISKYMILATIPANHCVADQFEDTNWTAILGLYR